MRLVHQTFLVLAAVALIAVAATTAMFALTLGQGFVAYVNARQLEQFEVLQRLLTAETTRTGSLDAVARDEGLWRRLVRRSAPGGADEATRDGSPRDRLERPPETRPDRPPEMRAPPPMPRQPAGEFADQGGRPPPFGDAPPPRSPYPPRGDGEGQLQRRDPERDPGPRPPPPPQSPYGLGQNVDLLDADRQPIYARPRTVDAAADPIERPLAVGSRTVGWLRLWPLQKVDRPEDIAFLRSQYVQLAWSAGGLVLLMLGVAPLVARRVTRPLSHITAATERIARGELDVDLPTTRRDEIGTLMRNVSGMADSLARLERARRRWIAEIAHELRTPLTVLQAELEALEVGVRPLNADAITSLQDETRHLSRLVGDLHQLALADLDALPCTMAPVDLADIARRVAGHFRLQAERKGLQLDIELPSRPVPLQADVQRLEQLVANLLQNSVRYTDAPGRILVRVGAPAGTEASGRAGTLPTPAELEQQVQLVVEDSAPGVTAAECERLFDPLYRADKARSRNSGGSGLGLSICRAIVHAHGGTIVAMPSALGGVKLIATFMEAA